MKNPSVPVWKPMPFLRVLPPFMGGILLANHWIVPTSFLLWIAIALFCFYLLTSFFPDYLLFRFPVLKSGPILLLVSLTGMVVCNYHHKERDPVHVSHSPLTKEGYFIELSEVPEQKKKTFKATAVVRYYLDSSKVLREIKGQLLVYFKTNPQLSKGDQLLVYAALEPIAHSGNPGTFNYRDYLHAQGVYRQTFLDSAHYTILCKAPPSGLLYSLSQFRQFLLNQIKKYIPDRNSYGLAEALLIGYKNDLDPSITTAYSNTGTMHVIAISGLHLGILYAILELLTNLVRNKKWNRWIRPIFILSGLWVFSWLAGANPSVLRSAVMFSGIVLAKAFNRNSPSPNTLSAAAFLLFCYEPNWIFDTGCQLSFAAVAGIQWTWKSLYTWYAPDNYWTDQLWKMTSVTLSAQVFTLPLCVYYFHQFPTYFLLTNLIAVPLSSLILIGILVLCAAYPLEWVCLKIGWLLNHAIAFMNQFVSWMDQLPGATIQPLMIDVGVMLLLFTIMIGFSATLLYKSKKWFYTGLLSLCVLSLYHFYTTSQFQQQSKWVVLNQRNLHLMQIEGNRTLVIANPDTGFYYRQNIKLVLQQYRIKDSSQWKPPDSTCFFLPHLKLGYFQAHFKKHLNPVPTVPLEVLVLGKLSEKQAEQLMHIYRPKIVIVLSVNGLSKSFNIRELCKKMNIDCWLMVEKGAFEKPL